MAHRIARKGGHVTNTMPHTTDNPELLLDPEQITAALKALVLYRVTESTSKDGVYTREITANDGRYDGDKKGLIAQLRKEILQKDEENRAIMEEKRATDAENAKLLCENNQLFNASEKKDNTIAALQKANETLQQKAITKQAEHQAATRDLKSQLDTKTRELQSRIDRSRDQDIKTQHLKDENASLKDEVSKGAEQQRIIEALNVKLIMSGKSYEALHAENKKTEEALMIAEHSLANSRVAVNPARISFIDRDDAEVKFEFVARETGHPDVIVNGTYEGQLEYFEYDMPDLENASHNECLKKEHSSQQSILENNDTQRLEDTNVREDSKDDDDVPIPGMMSAHAYRANQLALQKKAELAKHTA